MTLRSGEGDGGGDSNDETPISPTELRALRRLAEPEASATVQTDELWASRYRIVEPIGRGGMGDVFLARDVLLDRLVALKVLRAKVDEDMVDERLLLREARAAARAEHERIARVYDAGIWNDRAFIAMEYVRGETLREWLKKYRASPEEAIFIVQQLLEGVRALHERGLVHRDLKPENVMVASDGNLRILDLGIARRVPLGNVQEPAGDWPSSLTIGFGVGTPGYMAPEQWQGFVVDARADLFGLGVIIYELVVGRAPFRGSTNAEIRDKTLHAELSFATSDWQSMPSALCEATRRALCRDRDQRFSSVEPMIELLAPLFRPSVPPISGTRVPSVGPGEAPISAVDSGQASAFGVSIRALPPNKRRLDRKKWLAALSGGVVAVALAAGVLRHRSAAASAMPRIAGMVGLRGGTFSMGSDQEDLALQCPKYPRGCPAEAQNEVPRRSATVAPFEIDEHEVTNQEFTAFLNAIGSSLHVAQDPDDHYDRYVRYSLRSSEVFLLYDLWPGTAGVRFIKSESNSFHVRPDFEKLPVTQVSWLGARLFCKNAVKRLPTEAEWEFAAAGSERRPYPWGSAPPNCEGVHISSKGFLSLQNPDRCDSTREVPFPIMSAPQDITPDGVRDLAGNVAEWVDSDENVNSDEAAYARRLAFNVGDDIGFRCAKSLPVKH